MFGNFFHQTLRYLKSTSTTDASNRRTIGDMSTQDKSEEFYKIPSKPLKDGKNSLIFTRSQCVGNNQCSANCLVHKKRKRKAKLLSSENSNLDISINSVETESNASDQLLCGLDDLTTTTTSSSVTTKKMAPKRRSASRYSNLSKLSDDDEEEEEENVHQVVNRYNYLEMFSDFNSRNATQTSSTNRLVLRHSILPILVGLLIVFFASICFYSTSQDSSQLLKQNSILDFFIHTHNESSFIQNEEQLERIAKQINIHNNQRAIELFKQEFAHSFAQLNERIGRVEHDLANHQTSQQEFNRQLVDKSNKLNDRLQTITEVLEELKQFKVQIDQFISEFSLSNSAHGELRTKFDDIQSLVEKLIKQAIDKYDADKTGIVDYASEFAGGEIVSTGCTENYDLKGASYKILGVPIWSPPNIPRFVIQPNTSPGQCWYFKGNKGSLVIKLSRTILASNFSYEHISIRNAPDGHINSAPKLFEVRALDGPNADENWLLGEFEYDRLGDPIQYFKFENIDRPVEYVEFNVLDNHGNDEFTCLYRVRVHGTKVDKED